MQYSTFMKTCVAASARQGRTALPPLPLDAPHLHHVAPFGRAGPSVGAGPSSRTRRSPRPLTPTGTCNCHEAAVNGLEWYSKWSPRTPALHVLAERLVLPPCALGVGRHKGDDVRIGSQGE
jgi:hypothetical protein